MPRVQARLRLEKGTGRFELTLDVIVANKLKDEYPNLTAKHVRTYYYVHFLKELD
jgi:hypothetical protein